MTEYERGKIEGVKECIEELRNLQDSFFHRRKWNFSMKANFAPVELSDYLLIKVYRKLFK